MNINQKGFVNTILIAVVVIIVGVGGYFVFVKKSEPVTPQPTPSPILLPPTQTPGPTPISKPITPVTKDNNLNSDLVVPKYVSIFLTSSVENNKRVPVLVLSAVAGGGCDSASDLETKKSLSGNTLVVDIQGYKFTKGSGKTCAAVILESRAKVSIDLNWLKQGGEKEVIFKLGGRDNNYKISYSQYHLTLSGVQTTNVITNQPGYNPSDTPVTLEMTLYPADVDVMYLAGSVSSEKDYRPAMRNFAQAKGFVPAEQIYSGLEQNEKSQFYVVLKNYPMPEPNRGESLGNLPGEGVDVYLKQVVSDADYY